MLNEILASYDWYDRPEGLKFVETHHDAYRTSGHWLVCAPPFSFEQLVTADADRLLVQFPEHGALIRRLTR